MKIRDTSVYGPSAARCRNFFVVRRGPMPSCSSFNNLYQDLRVRKRVILSRVEQNREVGDLAGESACPTNPGIPSRMGAHVAAVACHHGRDDQERQPGDEQANGALAGAFPLAQLQAEQLAEKDLAGHEDRPAYV